MQEIRITYNNFPSYSIKATPFIGIDFFSQTVERITKQKASVHFTGNMK